MLTLFLLAAALSADGFAVSICRGAGTSHKWRNAIGTGIVFGFAHAVMISLGWIVGDIVDAWKDFAPWIACAILCLLGGKMLYESMEDEDEAQDVVRPSSPLLALVGLVSASIATSLDAAAAGITLPLMGLPLWLDALVIAGVTGAFSVVGYRAGALIGARWGKYAEFLGGAALIGIGVKMVLFP
jgi:putative Mn2+ efflux pump MntP